MSVHAPARLRRVDRWLLNDGRGIWPVSWDAARLLDQRLRARRSATWALAIFGVIAVGALVMSTMSSNAAAIRWWVVYVAALAVGDPVWQWLVIRRDRAIGHDLRRRRAPQSRRSLLRNVGWAPVTGAVMVSVTALTLLTIMLILPIRTPVVASYGIACAIALGCATAAVWRLGSGPVVAVDDSSLAVDARLRRSDFTNAFFPVAVLAASATVPVGLGGSPDVFGLWIMIGPASLLAFSLLRQLGRQAFRHAGHLPTPAAGSPS